VKRNLTQLNIATLRHPIDDPRSADFVDGLAIVNGSGEQSEGYVWRLQSDGGDATDIQVFADPLVIVNLTVWESLDALKAFAYRGIHRDYFRRRDEWFVEGASRTALWWVPAGVLPTTDDAKRRLDFIEVFGSSPYAFTMGQNHPSLVMDRVGPDDSRVQELGSHLDGELLVDSATVVVAELDDLPVACGAYRVVDDSTAEIRRMYVAQSARGMRVGAAVVAELESLARADGMRRLLLETWPRQLEALEQFGFRHCARWAEPTLSPDSVFLEKTLTAEASRLA
jgi:GNAT superfamily N-acetyltransferase